MVEWKEISGHPGYEAGSSGHIRSVDRVIMRSNGIPQTVKSRVLRPAVMKKSGHLQVSLSLDGVPHTYCVHALVCETFHGPRPEGMECRHLNGDPSDNRAENLQWGTSSENHLDRVRHGVHFWAKRTHCKNGHEFTPQNTGHTKKQRYCRTCRSVAVRKGRKSTE